MRLITIPIIILVVFIIFAVITPVLLLEGIESILPADVRQNTADIRQNIAHLLIDISSLLGRYDTCIDLYDYLIYRYPDVAEYYGKKAIYLHRIGKLEETVTALDEAIARDPESIDYLLRKARITKALYRNDESNQTYRQIDQITPKTAINFAYAGDAALDQSRYIQALERYTNSLALNPSDSHIWEKRGDVIFALLTIPTAGLSADERLRHQDLYTEGIQSYENAMRLKPDREHDIKMKMSKRSDIFVPKSIAELESRYTQYRYLG
jgi:tetratricopeptide (TPR) repeat protein